MAQRKPFSTNLNSLPVAVMTPLILTGIIFNTCNPAQYGVSLWLVVTWGVVLTIQVIHYIFINMDYWLEQ